MTSNIIQEILGYRHRYLAGCGWAIIVRIPSKYFNIRCNFFQLWTIFCQGCSSLKWRKNFKFLPTSTLGSCLHHGSTLVLKSIRNAQIHEMNQRTNNLGLMKGALSLHRCLYCLVIRLQKDVNEDFVSSTACTNSHASDSTAQVWYDQKCNAYFPFLNTRISQLGLFFEQTNFTICAVIGACKPKKSGLNLVNLVWMMNN